MYHVEVLNACTRLLAYIWQAEKAGICLNESARWAAGNLGQKEDGACGWLVKIVLKMSRHVLYSSAPDFMQLPQGDSDVTDLRDVMARFLRKRKQGSKAYTDTQRESIWIWTARGCLASGE